MNIPIVMSWSGGKDSAMALHELLNAHQYDAAVPFFRNGLFGDMIFTAVLFGGFALLERYSTSLQENRDLSLVTSR